MEKLSLKWDDFHENVSMSFRTLRKENDLCDITLVSDDGAQALAHKVVLSASSQFFKSVIRKAEHSNPMIYLNGIESKELNQILDYMYNEEVQIFQDDLDCFLSIAHKLKINGLGEKENQSEKEKDDKKENRLQVIQEDSYNSLPMKTKRIHIWRKTVPDKVSSLS